MNILKKEIHFWMSKMIIPVLDIKNGECVCGQSGNRSTYKKLVSIYGTNPIEIAQNLKKDGYELLYIADLDKLESTGDNSKLISKINRIIPVLLDNGIENFSNIEENENITTYNILATESINNLEEIEEIIQKVDNEKLVISVDIKDNNLMIKNRNIKVSDIINLINKSKIRYIIILNISQIGTKSSNKSDIEKEIIDKTDDVEYIMAGGITNDAIKDYQNSNINSFIVGTILHEGSLNR